jgi:hypothetical protein
MIALSTKAFPGIDPGCTPARVKKTPQNKNLIATNKSATTKTWSVVSCPAEAAAIAIAPTSAEGAGSGTADEAATAEIDFGQFGGVLSTQVVQCRADALMVALNRRAWAM